MNSTDTSDLETRLRERVRAYRAHLDRGERETAEFDGFLAHLIKAGWTYGRIEKATGIARSHVHRMVKRHRMRVGGTDDV